MAKNRVFRVGCQPNLKIFWNSDLLMGPLIMARRKVMEHFFRGKKPFRAQWPIFVNGFEDHLVRISSKSVDLNPFRHTDSYKPNQGKQALFQFFTLWPLVWPFRPLLAFYIFSEILDIKKISGTLRCNI